jgi:hypothetical protein
MQQIVGIRSAARSPRGEDHELGARPALLALSACALERWRERIGHDGPTLAPERVAHGEERAALPRDRLKIRGHRGSQR